MKTGIELIAAERQRQVEREGWTPAHDDEHDGMELTQAAAAYCEHAYNQDLAGVPGFWPWDESWWKPKDRIADLVRAGALIAAEIDRLQRAESRTTQGTSKP